MNLVFVVSTGRCGSTLLSRLLHAHPDILTIDELFSFTPMNGRLDGHTDGTGFWHHLADPVPSIDALLRDGVRIPELLYPYRTGRFHPTTGVPLISHIILPTLSDDPDALFDHLAGEIPTWPRAAVPDHYRRLFAHLATEHGGRPTVVERSGASIRFLAYLRRAFPEARYVYLSRDGVACALSMSRHVSFRLAVLAEVMEAAGETTNPARPGTPAVDTASAFQAPIPLSIFGSLWSSMTRKGADELVTMPADTWTALRYENLLTEPQRALRGLTGFLGLDAPAPWLAWAAAQIRPTVVHFPRTDPAAQVALREACAPGYDVDGTLHALQGVRR